MLHSGQVYANKSLVRGDDAGGEAEGGERYGFTDSVGLRKTYPDQNPDTLMLFSQALELKDWFWDTGFSESPKTRWNKLQGTKAGKETIESEGLTEPAQLVAKFCHDLLLIYISMLKFML